MRQSWAGALVAVGVACAEEGEFVMVDGVEPRDAGPIRAGHACVEGIRFVGERQPLAVRAVQPADELVMSCFGGGGGVAAEHVADGREGLAPILSRLDHGMVVAVGIIPVRRFDGGEDIDERRGGMDVLQNAFIVAFDERQDAVRAELVGLRVTMLVVPCGVGLRIVLVEDWEGDVVVARLVAEIGELVGEIIRIGIYVDVVVVEAPRYVVRFADGFDFLRLFDSAPRRTRRPDVRQSVVVAPTLPVMDGQHGVCHTVTYCLRETCDKGWGAFRAMPDVEDEATREIMERSCGLAFFE